jgi:hypothetical protein
MTVAIESAQVPPLYAHTLRKDWGVGLLSGETEGKRRYLFEDGEERTLANTFQQLMRRVERPTADQQAACARLRKVLAARARNDASGASPAGWSLLDQLDKLHGTYPAGLSDPKWAAEVRGEGSEERAPRHRQAMILEAQENLSLEALDSLLSGQRFGQVWDRAVAVLQHTDLVPAVQLKRQTLNGEQQRNLTVAVRELLHGKASYDTRLDRYLRAFAEAFGAYPRWELATALSALVHPTEHVCVEPTAFRKQLRTSASRRSVAAQPSGAGYTSFLRVARLIADKLAEHGELPRDLLDVRDFIVFTLQPAPKARPARKHAKASKELDSDGGDQD